MNFCCESELKSSSEVALASVRIIKKLIGESKWRTARDLLKILKHEEKILFERIPSETVVQNIWKRVVKIIKDESNRYTLFYSLLKERLRLTNTYG